jgi:hypothetical protein
MGFINLNGQQVHTSVINSGTSSTITNSSGSLYTTTTTNNTFIYSQKAKYFILGEEFEIEGYQDPTIAMMIACINIMGKPFYDDLVKQQVNIPEEIDEFIKKKFIILERDKKIEEIITTRNQT